MVVEATILARRGSYAESGALFDQHWRAIEETTPAALMRGTRLVRAFVIERAGGASDEVDQLVAGCKPFIAGEYDYIAVSWVELHAFLAARGLITGA